MRIPMLRTAAAGASLLLSMGAAHAASEVAWAKSFDAAMAQAKQTHKLVMADFYTDW